MEEYLKLISQSLILKDCGWTTVMNKDLRSKCAITRTFRDCDWTVEINLLRLIFSVCGNQRVYDLIYWGKRRLQIKIFISLELWRTMIWRCHSTSQEAVAVCWFHGKQRCFFSVVLKPKFKYGLVVVCQLIGTCGNYCSVSATLYRVIGVTVRTTLSSQLLQDPEDNDGLNSERSLIFEVTTLLLLSCDAM